VWTFLCNALTVLAKNGVAQGCGGWGFAGVDEVV